MTRHLVLLGCGPAHLRFLRLLAKRASKPSKGPPSDVKVTLVSRLQRHIDTALQMGFVAGRHAVEDCAADLELLVQKAGVAWLEHPVAALDANAQALLLANHAEIRFDWLSIDQEPVQSRDLLEPNLPGARANGLFVRPAEAFCTLWPRIPQLAKTRALRVAVIGDWVQTDGTARAQPSTKELPVAASMALVESEACQRLAIALALASAAALPGSAVTFITGGAPLGQFASAGLQRRLVQSFKASKITVLQDAAVAIGTGEVTLASGARLACDVPLLATCPHPPAFLADSGLALTAKGFAALDGNLRSTSHPAIFVALQAPGFDVRLAQSLLATVNGAALGAAVAGAFGSPPTGQLQFIDSGRGQTLASWERFSAQGRWLTWVKQWVDRRRLAQLRLP